MGRSRYLEPRAKMRILEILTLHGEIETEAGVEIILPHMTFDAEAEKRKCARRIFEGMMARRRDDDGTRNTFATKREDDQSVYVDLNACENLLDVQAVEKQLHDKVSGLLKSHAKALRRCRELEGQMSIAELMK